MHHRRRLLPCRIVLLLCIVGIIVYGTSRSAASTLQVMYRRWVAWLGPFERRVPCTWVLANTANKNDYSSITSPSTNIPGLREELIGLGL
jgi:hypothetical protein